MPNLENIGEFPEMTNFFVHYLNTKAKDTFEK